MALVLKRQVEEAFVITMPDGAKARVVICRVKGKTAWVAIEADESIKIVREELIQRDKEKG